MSAALGAGGNVRWHCDHSDCGAACIMPEGQVPDGWETQDELARTSREPGPAEIVYRDYCPAHK